MTALDLEAIVSDELRERADAYELASFEVRPASGESRWPRSRVTLPSGEEAVGESTGDGPIDAIFRAIQKAVGTECELLKYTVEAVTGGEDALGEVTVQLRTDGALASGSGVATDIIEATARAYLRALSNSLEGAATREAEAATADAIVERTRARNKGVGKMPRSAHHACAFPRHHRPDGSSESAITVAIAGQMQTVPDRGVAELAKGQHGIVGRAQLGPSA